MQWHAMRDLWRGWLQFFADESDPEDAAAARWVRGLDGVSVLASEDPVLLGMSDPGTRVESLRRTAREQLTSAFDPTRLVAAARRRDAAMDENSRPLAPAAIARPTASGELPVAGVPEGTEVRVPVKLESGWSLAPARVTEGGLQWQGRAPEPPITWPQTLFVPGGTP